MKILLTGASGYIGKQLLPVLVMAGHEVICCVRDPNRFHPPEAIKERIETIKIDLLEEDSLNKIPKDIDGAYYLVHSMSSSSDYKTLEKESAVNFRNALNKTKVKHVVYLSGIINESKLSKHLDSRKNVEEELDKGDYNFTTLRAGIIIGAGSASFEIMRDLVEKLPLMVAPKWLKTICQPIGVSDVISFLDKCMFNPKTFNQDFDIGGPDILSYKDMLLGFSRIRNLHRKIFIIPVMTPRLSSYWLYFVTSTSYKLAVALVNSMKIEVICRNDDINKILDIIPLSYVNSLNNTLTEIEGKELLYGFTELSKGKHTSDSLSDFIQLPTFGCLTDRKNRTFKDRTSCIDKIWSIGNKKTWYYGSWIWEIRGLIDKLFGGIGLRIGRTHIETIREGDTIDFWRVLYVDKKEGRLILVSEMKLPGEAWLEFKVGSEELIQTFVFRPLGLTGRIYWSVLGPIHAIIFRGMIKNLTE